MEKNYKSKKGVVEIMIYTCAIDTPLGAMTASAEQGALTGLWFIGQKYYPSKTGTWVYEPDYAVFEELRIWLDCYFSGRDCISGLRIDPPGMPFQKAVWDILLKIPFGQITTYGGIAKKIAIQRGLSSMSAQAVGGAVGHNPISILIPCHRVVGSNRSLTGYAGGLDKKEALLHLENVDMAKKFFDIMKT
ncbi:MAG: methylated-DNA--[protein]-cysteine S-methyltransferase [Syntrophobacteraceae bacterium]